MNSKHDTSDGVDLAYRLPSGTTVRELIQRMDSLMKLIDEGNADPINDFQRATAARIRMASDKKLGLKTQQWIVDLARSA